MMWIVLVIGLSLGTLAFRLAGLLAGSWLHLPNGGERFSTIAATVMLAALVVTATLSGESGAVGASSAARVTGVAAAGVLAWCRQPPPVIAIAAASVTAGLRFIGVA